jgi:uncharacterized protein
MYASLAVMPFLGIFGLMYIVLSWRVVRGRLLYHVGLGDGGHRDLFREIRIHGNFSEYVPFALLLLTVLDLTNHSPWLIRTLGLTLLVGRIMHVRGLLTSESVTNLPRGIGASLTWLVIFISSVLSLFATFR